jgi:uncharacterized membrane protein
VIHAITLAASVKPTHSMAPRLSVTSSIRVERPPETVFHYWADMEQIPRFIAYVESVERLGGKWSRWRASGPAGLRLEWDAELRELIEGERIAWESQNGRMTDHRGVVRFRQVNDGRETEVELELEWTPSGVAGALVHVGEDRVREEIDRCLQRFRQIVLEESSG